MRKDVSLQEFHKALQVDATKQGIPILGGFELTRRCNLSCKMCYVKESRSTEKELTTEEWIKIGRDAAAAGALSVYMTGGEPLVREDFKEIYDVFCRLGFRITLFTNGTLVDEEFVRWLSSTPPSTIDVTLYGASEDTYFNLCGSREAYGKARNGIELFLRNGLNVRIKTTIVKTNLQDYQAIKATAKAYGVEFISSRLIHGNRAHGISMCECERLDADEYYLFDNDNLDEFDCKPIDIDDMVNHYKDLPAMSCMAGKCSFFINWKGHMTPCPLFSDLYEEPLKTGYTEAWTRMRHKLGTVPLARKCQSCDLRAFCAVCPPRLQLETGSYEQPSDYLCSLARKKLEFVEKINAKAAEV